MDTVAQFLTELRNAARARHEKLDLPSSKMRVSIVTILKDEGFVKDFKVVRDSRQGMMRIYLKYQAQGDPVFTEVKRISKPGRRVYVKAQKIPKVRSGFGLAILSTNRGIVDSKKASIDNLGGELLCTIW